MRAKHAGLRQTLVNDGYSVVHSLFNEVEINQLKSVLEDFFALRGVYFNLGKTQPNAAMECSELSWLFSDPRVVEVFKGALGDDITFTGHCDIHQGMFTNWHKDTGHGNAYFKDDCFNHDCEVFKMAVYLQDHSEGGGITVRPGSHRVRDASSGEEVLVRTKVGDAVVFDVRLSHRGRAATPVDSVLHKSGLLLKKVLGVKTPGDLPAIYAMKQLQDRIMGRPTRYSIFFTFGRRNRFTEQFAEFNMARQLRQYRSEGRSFPADLETRLKSQGVELFTAPEMAPSAD